MSSRYVWELAVVVAYPVRSSRSANWDGEKAKLVRAQGPMAGLQKLAQDDQKAVPGLLSGREVVYGALLVKVVNEGGNGCQWCPVCCVKCGVSD